ncbi:P-loop containing nucleoside triphosphate hydrolase protein [Geopyxis carbonaria]|nr:P-loop containing nucleoside triphosphate hydrolase protein [Geopyxis carbonaria]
MPALVLGKRSRDFDIVVKSTRVTRSKRVTILDDALQTNTTAPRTEPIESTLTSMDLNPRTPKRARRTAPPKSAPPKVSNRLPLSPQKTINAVFKSAKSGAVAQTEKKLEVQKLEVPSTPRRRDRVIKPVTTPRRRVQIVGKPMTPRGKLFATPSAATPTKTIINTAKLLFSRSTAGGRLVGRDTERTQISNFLQPRLQSRQGGCMYVSGPPGCGKSALLTEIMEGISSTGVEGVKKAWVNCMSLHTPGAIYNTLMTEFSPNTMGAKAIELSDLEKLFFPTSTSKSLFVLVLDEIDHLLTNDILPVIFELALRKNSRLILIGIANALDLADRFLPRLKSKNLEPDLLQFHPYKKEQIMQVITVRLRSLLSEDEKIEMPADFTPFVHPRAIELLAARVQAASGDLRKAFDILRRAFEHLELEQQNKRRLAQNPGALAPIFSPRAVLGDNPNTSSPSQNPPPSSWTNLTAPRVEAIHVAKAASQALGSSVSSRITNLNPHQKAILCILVAKSGTSAFGLNKLRDCYTKACKEDTVALIPLAGPEFRNIVEGLEAAGVLDILSAVMATPKKANKGEDRVVSRVGKMDLFTAISASGGPGKDNCIAILGGPE